VARPRAKRRAEAAHQVDPSEARARAFWSGTLSFGLVSIPVYLYPANRRGGVSLRMLAPDGTPLARRYYSPESGDEVASEDLVRGYEIRPDEYVLVEDEELEALEPEKSREIDLRRFVPADSIHPLYFERAYFLTPAGDSNKAYRLLAQVMERTGRAGIATFVMRGKEYLVAILSEGGILRAETLRFADEVRTPEAIGLPEKREVDRHTVRRFEKAIDEAAAESLEPEELEDAYAARLGKLVEAKRRRGETVVGDPEETVAAEEEAEEPVDLMNVLKWSLKSAEKRSR
jgi:DNA end-binding protein Ku